MAERQERTAADAVLTRIGQVVMLHHAGDREEARGRLLDLWSELGERGDALHRCTLAHYLADTHDDPVDELAWDLRALSAAEELTTEHESGRAYEDDVRVAAVRAFAPSLHLNLAADYAKLGRPQAARSHLHRARRAADCLADDGCGYGDGVRAGIRRLELRLGEGKPPGGERGEGWGPPRQRP